MKEVFGAGTACVVCPVEKVLYNDEVSIAISTMLFAMPKERKHLYDHLLNLHTGFSFFIRLLVIVNLYQCFSTLFPLVGLNSA